MSLVAGTIQTLRLAREVSPHGYFLTDGETDVLLHYSELVGHKPRIGTDLEVFLFFDTDDRLAATMKRPLITLGEMARLKVADVNPRLGCFLEIGLGRQLLLPISELPENRDYRPWPGDEVFVTLSHDKMGRLIALLATEEQLSERTFDAPESWKNVWVEGWVTRTLQIGSFVLVDGGVVGFGAFGMIPDSERIRPLRLGERVSARVTFVREDGRVNLSMSQLKQIGRVEDADRILAFMKERPGGGMPYSDETPADVVKQRFGISKSAFKRALGKLMRDGMVTQKGSWTYLVETEQAEEAPEGAEHSELSGQAELAGQPGGQVPRSSQSTSQEDH
ncbi:S1 RNA-binding domain-containing protein [Paenibacillus sp. GCM10023252]|uniref:CvfB family protein n=1 Tax=Paenibacillus sp. GCM10023252 TaxID=3252649 RepID=UPI003623C3DC